MACQFCHVTTTLVTTDYSSHTLPYTSLYRYVMHTFTTVALSRVLSSLTYLIGCASTVIPLPQ